VVIIGDREDISTDQLRTLAISTIERAHAVEAEKTSVL
jgi:hypothetical protein